VKVIKLKEAGYREALLGLSLSYESEPSHRVAKRLSNKGGGHNKFLESIIVWLDVTAPRYWWQQADTYRLTSKQSGSTMHTMMRRPLTQDDFEDGVEDIVLNILNDFIATKQFDKVKAHLPESFLQRRVWRLDYKTLQNMIQQRRTHKLKEWQFFINSVLAQVEHEEFLC
jgi:uncharacterized protein (DUF2267 family)